MILQTERLDVRELTMDDLDAFAAMLADPVVMEYSKNGPLDRAGARGYLQTVILDHYAKYGYGLWALIARGEGTFVGFAGLIHQDIDGEGLIEFGYRLAPAAWGNGYATEAGRAIRDYAFETVGVDTLISIIEPANVRSVAVAEKVGMKSSRQAVYYGKAVTIFELTRSEWGTRV